MTTKTALLTYGSTLLIGIAIGIGIIFGYNKLHHSNYEPNVVIDSINNNIDSIQIRIDTIYIQKVKLKYVYESKVDTILNQSASDDWIYYTKYLSAKFPNNGGTTKAN